MVSEKTSQAANTIIYESGRIYREFHRPLKLQKLLWICYEQCLIKTNIEIIDEQFIALPYGPTILSLKQHYQKFKYNPIREWCTDINNKTKKIKAKENKTIYPIIIETIEKYAQTSDQTLLRIIQKVDDPWWQARINNTIIKKEYIK